MKSFKICIIIGMAFLYLLLTGGCKKSTEVTEKYILTTQLAYGHFGLYYDYPSPPNETDTNPGSTPVREYWLSAYYKASSEGTGLTITNCEIMLYRGDEQVQQYSYPANQFCVKVFLQPDEESSGYVFLDHTTEEYDHARIVLRYKAGEQQLEIDSGNHEINSNIKPKIREFISTKYSVQKDESVTLSWKVDYADKLELYWEQDLLAENLAPQGQITVTPSDSGRDANYFYLKVYKKQWLYAQEELVVLTNLETNKK